MFKSFRFAREPRTESPATPTSLLQEQQFAVLRQGPHLVVDDQFQLVDMITDLVQQRSHRIVISDRLGTFAAEPVGHLPSIHQVVDLRLDGRDVVVDLLDQLDIALRQRIGPLLVAENLVHLVDKLW